MDNSTIVGMTIDPGRTFGTRPCAAPHRMQISELDRTGLPHVRQARSKALATTGLAEVMTSDPLIG